jgi:hypothetical protein
LKEVDGILSLFLALCFGPVELVCHDIDDPRKGIKGCVCIEEGKTGTAGENINGRKSIFVTDCISHFCVDDWKWRKELSGIVRPEAGRHILGY